MVTEQKQVNELARLLKSAPWVSMDTEANSMYAYPERVCLIQLTTADETEAIVDPLVPGLDLSPLMKVLQETPLIMHGADYDLRLLYRGYKFKPGELFDTMLAGKLLGVPSCGLAGLCEEFMGVHLIKKYQKADWGKRPLSQELLSYAIKDAFYLHELKARLEKKLIECGKLEWHRQNCQRLINDCTTPVPADPTREWRLGGSEAFSRRELGVLRALWYWREDEAVRCNRPLFFVMRPDMLLQIAKLAAAGKEYRRLLPHYSNDKKDRLFKAVARAQELPQQQLPMKLRRAYPRFTPEQQHRLEYLTELRDESALKLQMSPTLIASRADLVGCVRNPDENHLTDWQRSLLGFEHEGEEWVFKMPEKESEPLAKKNSRRRSRSSSRKKVNPAQSLVDSEVVEGGQKKLPVKPKDPVSVKPAKPIKPAKQPQAKTSRKTAPAPKRPRKTEPAKAKQASAANVS